MIRSVETSVSFYQATQCHIPEESPLYIHRRESLRSNKLSQRLQKMFSFPEQRIVWKVLN
jgi:hypothetical protein